MSRKILERNLAFSALNSTWLRREVLGKKETKNAGVNVVT